jgi:uncharacterized membrane protein YeaQ/YmgE (transglycosylase-associated protein family)
MDWLFFALIGGAAGWLVAWATDCEGGKMIKPILVGIVGALAGGFLIVVLLHAFKALAPMAGAALGSLVLLSWAIKRGTGKNA